MQRIAHFTTDERTAEIDEVVSIVERVTPTTHSLGGLDQDHIEAKVGELSRSDQTRNASSNHGYLVCAILHIHTVMLQAFPRKDTKVDVAKTFQKVVNFLRKSNLFGENDASGPKYVLIQFNPSLILNKE